MGVSCGAQGGFSVPARGIQALGVGDVAGRAGIGDDFKLWHKECRWRDYDFEYIDANEYIVELL